MKTKFQQIALHLKNLKVKKKTNAVTEQEAVIAIEQVLNKSQEAIEIEIKPSLGEQFKAQLEKTKLYLNDQFQDFDINEPLEWKLVPRLCAAFLVSIITALAAWQFVISDLSDELVQAQEKETALWSEFRDKNGKAANLGPLKKQRAQVLAQVAELEKQLPSQAEMDALLSSINEAGLSQGVQFDVFRPKPIVMREFYAEIPISIKVSGNYSSIGGFMSAVAGLNRVVGFGDITINTKPENLNFLRSERSKIDNSLTLEMVAKTYRYTSDEEKAELAKASKKNGGKPNDGLN